jgi:hypothetical protein
MRVYLDEDSAGGLLVRLLRNFGHDVRLPAEIGKAGSHRFTSYTRFVKTEV